MRSAAIAGLTVFQAEVLSRLHERLTKPGILSLYGEPLGWCRPTDIGGAQQTGHSARLNELARKRFVDTQPFRSPHAKPGKQSPQKIYKISDAGIEALQLYREATR